jgi:hypothetical protein
MRRRMQRLTVARRAAQKRALKFMMKGLRRWRCRPSTPRGMSRRGRQQRAVSRRRRQQRVGSDRDVVSQLSKACVC